jgi:hypothetical protein
MLTPDNWIVFTAGESPPRLLVGWSGGYTQGSSWRISSGISSVEEDEYYFYFTTPSGTRYQCHKEAYCLRMNNSYVWGQLEEQYKDSLVKLDSKTNWKELTNDHAQ